jgi:hypothetical protein
MFGSRIGLSRALLEPASDIDRLEFLAQALDVALDRSVVGILM